MEEKKERIRNYRSEKALGMNGFTIKFLKKFWNLLQVDIMPFVKHFEENGKLSKGFNSSFITIITKVKDPITFNDFQPISLIGCMYKIIAKVVALRIKKVIKTVIDEVQ